MSVLVHRCRSCTHLEDRHGARERGYQTCHCCNTAAADLDPEPELSPTFTFPGGRPEPLWPPGSTRNSGTPHLTQVCGCGRCRERAAVETRSEHGPGTGKMGGDQQP